MAIGRSKRRAPFPSGDPGEVISLSTLSGRSLAVEVREPIGASRGTAILLHSMMASRRIWNSPREQGVTSALNEAGLTYITTVIDYGAPAGQSTQRTRMPREALAGRAANCIDGTVQFASLR